MSSEPESLDVWLPGVKVGQLTRLEDEVHIFEPSQEYLELQHRPTLGQLFEDLLPASLTTVGAPHVVYRRGGNGLERGV